MQGVKSASALTAAARGGLPIADCIAPTGAKLRQLSHFERRFVEMSDSRLADEPDPSIGKYVDGLKARIRGNP